MHSKDPIEIQRILLGILNSAIAYNIIEDETHLVIGISYDLTHHKVCIALHDLLKL